MALVLGRVPKWRSNLPEKEEEKKWRPNLISTNESKYNSAYIARLRDILFYVEERDMEK